MTKFTKPTIEEITEYCTQRGNSIDPEAFYYFYESKDWMIGKNKMKSWQAAVITWEKRDKTNERSNERKSKLDEAIDSINRHRPV